MRYDWQAIETACEGLLCAIRDRNAPETLLKHHLGVIQDAVRPGSAACGRCRVGTRGIVVDDACLIHRY
ncbi:MAG TPA: hypothetical protein VD813_14165 [Pseudonocardia sp.]|nr:hypothetical protein [Pseudonocardia sp.]